MSNPYESAFGEEPQPPRKPEEKTRRALDFSALPPLEGDDLVPALDELLQRCAAFAEQARDFGQLLTRLRVIDHEVPAAVKNAWLRVLVQVNDPHRLPSLAAERKFYRLLKDKFIAIIVPMQELARKHLECLRQFVTEIDEHYYDPNRTELEVKRATGEVKDDILLQRRILFDAQQDLSILKDALEATEFRLKDYINTGGDNNLASSELVLLKKERAQLTSGSLHHFNYDFFALNLLDRAALTLGRLPRQTTSQYLDGLSLALEARS